jgi:sugar phosphate isomerase/epimerase
MNATEARYISGQANLDSIIEEAISAAAREGKTCIDLVGLASRYPTYSEEIDAAKEKLRAAGFYITTELPAQENTQGQLIISWKN